MAELLALLDFLSRALALVLAVGAALGFVLRRWIGAAIDAHFEKRVAQQVEALKHEFAASLEDKKASLTREIEREKASLQEAIRREAYTHDKNLAFYEAFNVEFGRVIAELYSIVSLDDAEPEADPLVWAAYRKAILGRTHALLMDAQRRIDALGPYVDVHLLRRIAALFAALSGYMADGAPGRDRLDELAVEKGMIDGILRDGMGVPLRP